jgi:hypothetical protein
MTLTDQVVKNIITRVIKSQDYRIEIVSCTGYFERE